MRPVSSIIHGIFTEINLVKIFFSSLAYSNVYKRQVLLKNCATCPYISHGLTTYTFFSTGETRLIKFKKAEQLIPMV